MRRSSLILSAAFHIAIFIFAVTGLPFLSHREFVIPPPITVDFLDISKVTETNRVSPQPVAPPEKPEPKPPEKEPPPAPAKNTAASAVVPVPKEKPKQEDKKETKKETKAEAIDPNALPDKNKSKKEEAKKEPPKDFSSVLKNLADPKDKMVKAESDTNPLDKTALPDAGQNAPIGQRMTMSEEDALRGQLEKCWNVPFGAKDAENMIVEIFMVINPDRTLREARVVNTVRYNADSFYRAAADSALRAVRSPLCSPFDLPPDKYKTWNTVTVTFNPKDMF